MDRYHTAALRCDIDYLANPDWKDYHIKKEIAKTTSLLFIQRIIILSVKSISQRGSESGGISALHEGIGFSGRYILLLK